MGGVNRRDLERLKSLQGRHDDETRSLIRQCIEAGAPTEDIAQALGISRSTLWRHYGEELRRNARPNR